MSWLEYFEFCGGMMVIVYLVLVASDFGYDFFTKQKDRVGEV